MPETKFLSNEEAKVEHHFLDNVTRDNNGRYIVKLPFNEQKKHLGDSYSITLKRFYASERKLQKNTELKNQYVQFMREYKNLKHMSEVTDHENHPRGYYLPHHAVIKESSSTTKVRVVFDGSAKSDTSTSLNDTLNIGPTIQEELFSILIRFRSHIYVLVAKTIQLHGFCDASEAAYGACIYTRSVDSNNKCYTQLVCSKSKVAPLNSKITIPRLELCAALLLARLYKIILVALPITFDETFFWSDSTIALNWINTQPNVLKTFVANRVSEIRSITNYSQWNHVPSKENPADFISRGQTISEFLNNSMWKTGPEWLRKNVDNWPNLPIQKIPLLEVRPQIVLNISITDTN
ncbi:uncharacterized protein LOC112906178 [Agrilus planipennis]|uniref:Uncharacterized protein LOC112906178 n=1 Tax=Agrilus planipennis TaxID=224129 RepID=A0A7F5RIC2_AGRPL|nr:uncharacterized protein LOC112906178 [Agrilus planipennis]